MTKMMKAAVKTAVEEQCVICVDDDFEFLKSMEFFLPEQINSSTGATVWYRFVFLDNPRDALDLAREIVSTNGTLTMVISDQKMPQMTGTQLLAQIKSLSPATMRVLLTGHAGIESAIDAINEELLHKYLTKPISNEHDFMLNIRHVLERFQMARTIAEQDEVIHELYLFSNTLNAMDDEQGVLNYIVTFSKAMLRCERVGVMLFAGGELRIVAADGLSMESVGGTVVGMDDATARELLGNRSAGLAATLTEIDFLRSGTAHPDLASGPVLHAGLSCSDQCLGVILVTGRPDDDPLGPRDVEALTYIANTAAIALHNNQNRKRLEDALVHTEAQASEIAAANVRLHLLDRLKSDFLTFISHELRTPLSVISAVDLVVECTDAAERAEAIAIVRGGYERLQELVQAGVDYLRWVARDPIEEGPTTDLGAVVRSAVAAVQHEAKGFRFLPTIPDEPCRVIGDAPDLEEVVEVLLRNAVKFSDGNPSIKVGVAPDDGASTLWVTDQGAGFAPELAAAIFEPFTITDSLHHQRGTALNLAKAKAIVEAHGGSIRAESPGPGRGATFSVTLRALPRRQEPVTEPAWAREAAAGTAPTAGA